MPTYTGDRLLEVYICTEHSDACRRIEILSVAEGLVWPVLRFGSTTSANTGATYSTYIAFSDVGSLRLPPQVTVYQGYTLDAVLTHM